jgi:hypothetical protein
MSLLKDIVARGIYYNSAGVKDYLKWSQKLFDDYGAEIKPIIREIRKWSITISSSYEENRTPKINCWEFMGCSRLQSDRKVLSFRRSVVCPAALEKKYDGLYGGENSGRACWMVINTRCNGTVQKTFEQKCMACLSCDFYYLAMEEEEDEFIDIHALKGML